MSDKPEPRRFGNVDLLQKISLVWFAMALLCIPVWWKTTSVERYPIPYDEISECSQLVSKLPQSADRLMTLSESYDVLVTLVLPDINADWNIEESSVHLQNWAADMKHIANFTISSQIIYHPISLDRPTKKDDYYFYSKSKLSNVINSLEAYLQSNLNPRSKLIQLVAYVPPPKNRPLFVGHAQEDKKRSLLPDWGSFAIVDADISSNEVLDANQLIQSFVEDLDTLFDRTNVKKARTLDNIRTTSNTLNSLSSLLKRVHNMVINEHVSTMINQSARLLKMRDHVF